MDGLNILIVMVNVNYSKEFSENGVYQFDIYDLAGNKKTITVEINKLIVMHQ